MVITDYKVSESYSGRDISSLSDRPNADGLSAAALKARFDQLGKEVIPNYNDLIDFINLNLFSGGTQIGHTHNVDILEDGTTNRLYTDVEKTKLAGIAEGAEVNQNAFSNVKVGSTTIASSVKTDTLELVAGLNVSIAVDALTKKITLSATGDLATEAVQSYIEDIGNYFTSLNVEGALQEVGAKLSPSSSKTTPVDADTLLIADSEASNVFKKLSWVNIKATLKTYFDTLYNLYVHPTNHAPSIIEQDASNRFVTDAEKTAWNAKQEALVSGTNIKTINGNSILDSGDVELLPKNNPTATGTQTLPNIVTNGIKFPATQVPSADPNTLDDYEKGAFTPTIGASVGSFTTTSAYGRYTKIGNVVTCVVEFSTSNIGTASGAIAVNDLPFIVGTAVVGGSTVVGQEISKTGVFMFGFLTSYSIINIYRYDRTPLIGNGHAYKFLFTYITD